MAPCEKCGRHPRPRSKSPFCPDCLKGICSTCWGPKPRTRRNKRCADCLRQERNDWFSRPERRCTGCKEVLPKGRRDWWCQPCRTGAARHRRAELAKAGVIVCSRCNTEQAVPGYKTCTSCQTAERRTRRQGKAFCRNCGLPLSDGHCELCTGLVAMWGEEEVQKRQGGGW